MKLLKEDGFTLVELVVVVAILAVLASIAVPAYSGYIREAEEADDLMVCEAVKIAVLAAYLQESAEPPARITITNGEVELTEPYATNFAYYFGETEIPDNLCATWDSATSSWTITPAE